MSLENDNALCDCYAVVWLKAKHRRSQCATRHILTGDVNKLIPQVNALMPRFTSTTTATNKLEAPKQNTIEETNQKPKAKRGPRRVKKQINVSDETKPETSLDGQRSTKAAEEALPIAIPVQEHSNGSLNNGGPSDALDGTGSTDAFSCDDLTKMLETEVTIPGSMKEEMNELSVHSRPFLSVDQEGLHSRIDDLCGGNANAAAHYAPTAALSTATGTSAAAAAAGPTETVPPVGIISGLDWAARDDMSELTEVSNISGDHLSMITEERFARLEEQIQRLSQLQLGHVTLHAANVTIITTAAGVHQCT